MRHGRRSSRHRLKKTAGLMILILSVAVPSLMHADDEFKALPGLWKTTFVTGNSTSPATPVVNWHCVYEGSDPWTSFVYPATSPDRNCKKTFSYRTSTSLKWRLDCTSPTITDEGAIVFNAADHYTGKVELHGTLMGYPIDQTIMVEGKRYAACTSPQD